MLFSRFISLINHYLFWSIAIAVFIPSLVFFLECLAGVTAPPEESNADELKQPSLKILVPAHNEADNIRLTLESLVSQVEGAENIIVIADNCTDQTAEVARSCGVTVLKRQDPKYPGKGYALDYALQTLEANPPDAIIVIDADCWVAPGTVTLLAHKAVHHRRPIQATYLMPAPELGSITDHISAFAIKVRNLVRTVGITALGYPCILAGSGMAFPWDVLQQVSLAGSQCVDDMQLTIDLAIAGHPTQYTTAGRISGRLMQEKSAQSQRSRWEHGHLQVIFTQVPKLFREGWRQKRLSLVMLGLDLSVPPLSLLVTIWLTTFIVASAAAIGGLVSWLPAGILGVEGTMLSLALGAAWLKFGRQDLPFKMVLAIPTYLLWKLPVYFKFLVQPQTLWLKTERDIQPTTTEQQLLQSDQLQIETQIQWSNVTEVDIQPASLE